MAVYTLRCSKNHVFLKIIMERPRNLSFGQVEQDETKKLLDQSMFSLPELTKHFTKGFAPKYKRNNYFKNFLPDSASSLLKKQFTVTTVTTPL